MTTTIIRKRRYGGYDVSGLTKGQRDLFERARTSRMGVQEAKERLARLSPAAPYLLRQVIACAAAQIYTGAEL